jgi:hypothetical protein
MGIMLLAIAIWAVWIPIVMFQSMKLQGEAERMQQLLPGTPNFIGNPTMRRYRRSMQSRTTKIARSSFRPSSRCLVHEGR